MLRIAVATLAIAVLAACSPPKPPEEERRPEPQAQARARAQPQPRRPAQPAIADSSDAYKEGMRESVYAQQQKAERERAKIEAAAK